MCARIATKTSSKKHSATKATALAAPRAKQATVVGDDTRFAEVIALIETARARGYQAVNTVLVEHYWELGATPARGATRVATSSACASSSRRTGRTRKCHRW